MSLDPDVMAGRLRSYATAIAADQGVSLWAVLSLMKDASDRLAWVEYRRMMGLSEPQRVAAPQDVTNA